MQEKKEILRLKDFVKKYSHIVTLNQMRRILRVQTNGHEIFTRRCGPKLIYIDVDKFFEWIEKK